MVTESKMSAQAKGNTCVCKVNMSKTCCPGDDLTWDDPYMQHSILGGDNPAWSELLSPKLGI